MAGGALVILGLGLAEWSEDRSDYKGQVEREVNAGVPDGTPVEQARQWIASNPAADDVKLSDVVTLPLWRLDGRSAPESAGVPAENLRELICFRVRRHGWRGQVTGQVWVYLLIGDDGNVRGSFVTANDPPPNPYQHVGPRRPWWKFW